MIDVATCTPCERRPDIRGRLHPAETLQSPHGSLVRVVPCSVRHPPRLAVIASRCLALLLAVVARQIACRTPVFLIDELKPCRRDRVMPIPIR